MCRCRKLSEHMICSNSVLHGGHGGCRGRGAPSRPASDQLQGCHGGLSCSRHENLVMIADPNTHCFLSAQTHVSCQIVGSQSCIRAVLRRLCTCMRDVVCRLTYLRTRSVACQSTTLWWLPRSIQCLLSTRQSGCGSTRQSLQPHETATSWCYTEPKGDEACQV